MKLVLILEDIDMRVGACPPYSLNDVRISKEHVKSASHVIAPDGAILKDRDREHPDTSLTFCDAVVLGAIASQGKATEARLLQALKDLTMTARTFRNVPVDDQMWTTLDDAALDQAFALIGELDPNYINETTTHS